MKRFLATNAVLILLTFSTTAQAESPVVEWIRQLGTTSLDFGCDVSVDGSGNAYVTGCTLGGLDGNINSGWADMFLTKYDTDGKKLWTRQLGTSTNDFSSGVSVDGKGNAYVTGSTHGGLDGNINAGYSDIFLIKYDKVGKKLWTRQLGTNIFDCGEGVSVDGSGNAYVTGYTKGGLDGNTSAGKYDIFLTKYDTDGNKLWTRQLGTANDDKGAGVSVDAGGNAYVTGTKKGSLDSNARAGDVDIFLTKYDKDGKKLWTRQLGTSNNDSGSGVSVDSSGNAYVTGYTEGGLDGNTSAGGDDMFLTKYDADGNKLWTKQLGTAKNDFGYGVSVDPNGNAYVTGLTLGSLDGNTSTGGSDMFLTKYDTAGTKLWTRQLGTSSSDYGHGVSVDGSDNAYVTGETKGGLDGNTSAGVGDTFLTKISAVP